MFQGLRPVEGFWDSFCLKNRYWVTGQEFEKKRAEMASSSGEDFALSNSSGLALFGARLRFR